MQRSVRPSRTSSHSRGSRARVVSAVVGVTALLVGLGTGAAQAHDRGRDGNSGTQWQQKEQKHQKKQTTGAYVYLKKDADAAASWENSTQQYLVATWPGASWRDLTLDEVAAALPADLTLCGPGWGVQQDQAWGDETVFTENLAPSYPKDYIGWPPIFKAKHWSLEDMVTVPACDAVAPSPTPSTTTTPSPTTTPTPTQTPTPTPSETPTPTTPAVPAPAPAPSETPVTEVDATPTPTPTVEEVAAPAAPVVTPSPSATFYSEVLAAGGGGGAVLAATGSSPAPGILVGGILVLAGAALVLLRRRRAS